VHALPLLLRTLCFGQTRKVSWQSTVSVGGAVYLVPCALVDERVWVRVEADELVVVHTGSPAGPREVARHQLTTPGRPRISAEHYPPSPPGALERVPRARSGEEEAFLLIGEAAAGWLTHTAADRVRRKMAEAVSLAKFDGRSEVDQALATAARAGGFGEGDLGSILAHQATATVIPFPTAATLEPQSLQRSTQAWKGCGA